MKKIFFLAIITSLLIYGCVEPPDYPNEPVIEFRAVNSNQLVARTIPEDASRQLDTLYISFGFTDGDGDLGSDSLNVFVTDKRTGNADEVYSIGEIPQAGATNGISGEITVMIPEVFCFPNSNPRDTLIYEIQIFDKAGNASNVIETSPIILICD